MTEFSPTPETAAALIESFLDPAVSLDDLARRANTSTESLSLWLSRPDIQERLAGLDNTAALRTRMVAGAQLPIAAKSLSTVLADFNAGRLAPEQAEHSQAPTTPTLRIRAALCIVRAANALMRLSRFAPGPAQRRTQESTERELGSLPLRSGGGGGRVFEAGGGVPDIQPAPGFGDARTGQRPAPQAAQIRVAPANASLAGAGAAAAPIEPPTSPASDPEGRVADPRGEAARHSRSETGPRTSPGLADSATPSAGARWESGEGPRPVLSDDELDARLARLDAADAQLAEIASQLGESDDLSPKDLDAMGEALESGDSSRLSPGHAAIVELVRAHGWVSNAVVGEDVAGDASSASLGTGQRPPPPGAEVRGPPARALAAVHAERPP